MLGQIVVALALAAALMAVGEAIVRVWRGRTIGAGHVGIPALALSITATSEPSALLEAGSVAVSVFVIALMVAEWRRRKALQR